MRFSAEWIENGPNASIQEKSTLCDLQILIGNGNACTWEDLDTGQVYHHLTLPAVHLAEGISSEWWSIFGARDHSQSILKHRTGFALPDLRFSFDGSVFFASGRKLTSKNPHVKFPQEPFETLTRPQAEQALSSFIQQVMERTQKKGIRDTEVATCWSRVKESMSDPEETGFCEAAGALGADPYAIDGSDASFIEEAGSLFSGEELIEFLAKYRIGRQNAVPREIALRTIREVNAKQPETARLPDLPAAIEQVSKMAERRDEEQAWAPAYRAARALRDMMGMKQEATGQSPAVAAAKLGNKSFRSTEGLAGADAAVSRTGEDVYVYLSNLNGGYEENFAFARAIGSAVCFPEARLSVVNELRHAERQNAGRAFAAEFLAPAETVMSMHSDGVHINDISRTFNVSPVVIGLQMENTDRIQQACS